MSKIINLKRVRVHLEVEKKDAIQEYDGVTLGFDYNPESATKEKLLDAINEVCEEMKERFKEMIENGKN